MAREQQYPPASENDTGGQPLQTGISTLADPGRVAPNNWDTQVVLASPNGVAPPAAPQRAFDISGDPTQLGARTIVQQPGTMSGDPQHVGSLHRRSFKTADGITTKAQASDKYAAMLFMIDNIRAYQLLPPDEFRKCATIIVPAAAIGALAVLIGPEPLVDAGGGYPIYAGNNVSAPFIYTSKAPLYAIGVSGIAIQLNIFLERYNDGMPIN